MQAAKDRTNEVLATGEEPELEPEGSLDELLAQARERRLRLHPGVRRAERARTTARIADLVRRVRRAHADSSSRTATGRATSTRPGQLHKGGPNTGLFLQVVDDPGEELPIPGRKFGFRRLIRAQAAGDFESLQERGRRVARCHVDDV